MSRLGDVLFFEKSSFFVQLRFWIDLLLTLDGFGMHFGSQNETKVASKRDQKMDGFLDRSWKGSGARKGRRATLNWAVQGSRGGVGKG